MTYEHKPLLDQSPELLCEELLVFYEAFRRLGFTPDEIFLSNGIQFRGTDTVCFGFIVKPEGWEYCCAIGTSTGSLSDVHRVWSKMNEIGVARAEALWRERMPLEKFEALAASVIAKGLPMRALLPIPRPSFKPRTR